MSPLQKAIKLREWTRRALEADDAAGDGHMTSTRPLFREAEAAVRELTYDEFVSYALWCDE